MGRFARRPATANALPCPISAFTATAISAIAAVQSCVCCALRLLRACAVPHTRTDPMWSMRRMDYSCTGPHGTYRCPHTATPPFRFPTVWCRCCCFRLCSFSRASAHSFVCFLAAPLGLLLMFSHGTSDVQVQQLRWLAVTLGAEGHPAALPRLHPTQFSYPRHTVRRQSNFTLGTLRFYLGAVCYPIHVRR